MSEHGWLFRWTWFMGGAAALIALVLLDEYILEPRLGFDPPLIELGALAAAGIGGVLLAQRLGDPAPAEPPPAPRREQQQWALDTARQSALHLDETLSQLMHSAQELLPDQPDPAARRLLRQIIVATHESQALVSEIDALLGAPQELTFGGERLTPDRTPCRPSSPASSGYE